MGALSNRVYSIEGFLSADEAELLYRLATEVPENGNIVEIGSYRGKSTVCLGLGARWAKANVWAIDPHENYQVNAETHYGMENHAALLRNLLDFGVAETVRVVALPSEDVCDVWSYHPDLVFIDGSHEYIHVLSDLISWEHMIDDGVLAMHDTNASFPDVDKALTEFLDKYPSWKVSETVDSITVLERA